MDGCIVVLAQARTVMRALRPAVWPVLLDVALDAEWRDGCLVAATSARLVAEHLRIDPGTAAAGLRALRQHGLVELAQASGADGRFGLAIYTLHLPDGIVCWPHKVKPQTEKPDTDEARAGNAHADEPNVDKPEPATAGSSHRLVLSCPWDGDLGSTPPQCIEPAQPEPPAHLGEVADGARQTAPLTIPPASPTDAELRYGDTQFETAGAPGAPPRRRRRTAANGRAEQGAFDLGTDV